VLLVVEVLVEEETVLACCVWIFGEEGTIPHESATLDVEEKMVLSPDALVVIWYS
jgi:hypothetical protein